MQLWNLATSTGTLRELRSLLPGLFVLIAFLAVPGCGGEETRDAGSAGAGAGGGEAAGVFLEDHSGDSLVVGAPGSEMAAGAEIALVGAETGAGSASPDRFSGLPRVELPELLAVDRRVALPEFKVRDLNGREITSEDLPGNVVLLNFWATWCQPCKMEIPVLVYLHETYADAGLQIIAPSIDRNGLAAVKPFLDQRPEIEYTIIPNGMPVAQAFGGIRSIPTSFLVDRRGRVVKAFRGLVPKELLEGYIQSALREEV